MSLDLLKNALYQAIKPLAIGLVVYPEHVDNTTETFPNVSFVEIDTKSLGAKVGYESFQVASGANFSVYPVIDRLQTTIRLQYRDSLGSGLKDKAAYQKIRDTHNALERYFAKTRAIAIGTIGQNLAELYYRGSHPDYDPKSSIYLYEYELFIDPWRLIDTTSVTGYGTTQIEVDTTRQSDGTILISRFYHP